MKQKNKFRLLVSVTNGHLIDCFFNSVALAKNHSRVHLLVFFMRANFCFFTLNA